MTELEEYIKSCFGVVEPGDLRAIASLFRVTTIKKGEFLLKAGSRCDKLSFVQSGLLRMFVTTEEKEITQWISTKGFFSGDISGFLFETPSRFTIQALVDTEISSISINDYKLLGTEVPRWNEIEKIFVIRCFIMLEDRILRHLSMTAEERYQYLLEHNGELFNQVPLQYIASLLGMSPETLSRIRKNQLK